MKIVLKSFLFILLILFIAALLCTIILGYDNTINKVLEFAGKTEKRDMAVALVTHSRFIILQAVLAIGILLSVFSLYKFDTLYYYIHLFFSSSWIALKNIGAELKNRNLLLVLAIPFIASVYFGLTIPVSCDEGATYFLFTMKPFYNCMIFYPYPNNHIFHSLITNIAEYIPFFDILFRIRIPVIISTFLTWVIAYSFVKKYSSEKVALFVVAISAVLFRSIYYSFMSRGYSMVVLFFVICLYAAFNIIKNGNRTKDWMFFSVSGILGCYTMPSFLYPFITVNIIILIYNYRNIKKQVIYNLFAGIGTLILYTPIILINGIGALTNNGFVSPDAKSKLEVLGILPFFMKDMIEDIFGVYLYIIPVIILLVLILLVKRGDKDKLILWAVFLLTLPLLLAIHNVIPFFRTFVYYGFALVFLIGISLSVYIDKIQVKYLLCILIIIQVCAVINFRLKIDEDEGFNTYIKVINDKIVEEGKTYDITSSYSRYNLIYEVISRGYDAENVEFREGHKDKIDADTINNVDYVIIDIDKDETKIKKPYYIDKCHHVYLNKE